MSTESARLVPPESPPPRPEVKILPLAQIEHQHRFSAVRDSFWAAVEASRRPGASLGRGDDTVGNPHRARISQFELFELILLLKLDERFPVEQFEAADLSQQYPSPPLPGTSLASRRGQDKRGLFQSAVDSLHVAALCRILPQLAMTIYYGTLRHFSDDQIGREVRVSGKAANWPL